jgi:hypothetical protein
MDVKAATENELSEAINSMFKWYQDAGRCYIYLSDIIDRGGEKIHESELERMLRPSQWFSRGWTLQELIAPKRCSFFDANWTYIGSKRELAAVLSRITRIDKGLLEGHRSLNQFSIAQKMSWAAFRKTAKIEDRAYFLCGLFDVELPTLYGEKHKAFHRLQKTLMERSTDQSLFAWVESNPWDQDQRPPWLASCSWLAPSPDCFYSSSTIVPYNNVAWDSFWSSMSALCLNGSCCTRYQLPPSGPFGTNNMGFEITLLISWLANSRTKQPQSFHEAALFCFDAARPDPRPCTVILSRSGPEMHRVAGHYLGRVARRQHQQEHSHWMNTRVMIPTSHIWRQPVDVDPAFGAEDVLGMLVTLRNATHESVSSVRGLSRKKVDEEIAEAKRQELLKRKRQERITQERREQEAEERRLEHIERKHEKREEERERQREKKYDRISNGLAAAPWMLVAGYAWYSSIKGRRVPEIPQQVQQDGVSQT